MAPVTPSSEDNVKNIYFSPEKVNFTALIQAAEHLTPAHPSSIPEGGFLLGDAPFVSRSAFDRSYYRFAAFTSAPPHRPSCADPHAEILSQEPVGKINCDSL